MKVPIIGFVGLILFISVIIVLQATIKTKKPVLKSSGRLQVNDHTYSFFNNLNSNTIISGIATSSILSLPDIKQTDKEMIQLDNGNIKFRLFKDNFMKMLQTNSFKFQTLCIDNQ